MGPRCKAMITTNNALDAPMITLQILATPAGVLIRADGRVAVDDVPVNRP